MSTISRTNAFLQLDFRMVFSRSEKQNDQQVQPRHAELSSKMNYKLSLYKFGCLSLALTLA